MPELPHDGTPRTADTRLEFRETPEPKRAEPGPSLVRKGVVAFLLAVLAQWLANQLPGWETLYAFAGRLPSVIQVPARGIAHVFEWFRSDLTHTTLVAFVVWSIIYVPKLKRMEHEWGEALRESNEKARTVHADTVEEIRNAVRDEIEIRETFESEADRLLVNGYRVDPDEVARQAQAQEQEALDAKLRKTRVLLDDLVREGVRLGMRSPLGTDAFESWHERTSRFVHRALIGHYRAEFIRLLDGTAHYASPGAAIEGMARGIAQSVPHLSTNSISSDFDPARWEGSASRPASPS